jgi:hypothetical protein
VSSYPGVTEFFHNALRLYEFYPDDALFFLLSLGFAAGFFAEGLSRTSASFFSRAVTASF